MSLSNTLFFPLLFSALVSSGAGLTVQNLRCEYLENPLGIDVLAPRLSWSLQADERGQRQTAYQVLVASTAERLETGQGDVWDSGKVASDQTMHIVYAGSALTTRQTCFWKARAWDKTGSPSPWSAAASWSMGLLQPADWGASWIATFAPTSAVSPHNGYHSALATSADTPKWVTVDLGSARDVEAIRLYPARPYDYKQDVPGFLFPVRFKIETALSADFSDAALAVDQTVADVANPGTEAPVYAFASRSVRYIRLTATRLAFRDVGNYAFALAELQALSGGANVAQGSAVSALDSTESGGWSKAKLTDGRLLPDPGTAMVTPPATMLRKEFALAGSVKRATVSVTGLGLYELTLNGQRVGDHLLAPEWTRFGKRIQYQTYDVTPLLRDGANAIGAQLCSGWWAGPLMAMPTFFAPQYCLLLRLDIERADGSTQTVVSDGTWQATDSGPIRRSELYYGEVYDATKEQPGWDQPGFAANGWTAAQVLPCPTGSATAVLVAQPSEPIRVKKELVPVRITQPNAGVYVFDMGQNMVGWCRLKTDAPAGTVITLRFGEALNDDGTVYLGNLRGATQINTYTWRGGAATLEPHFTYFGFRYVQVTGLTEQPGADTLLGRVFHSDAPQAGTFSCSSDLLNAIMRNVEWTQRANMMSAPTDCPQRDERLGWMGDILSFSQTAIFNRDMAAFLTKWVPDIRDSQADDGRYPDVAPHVSDPNATLSGVPGWGDAGTVVPWRMYQNYGDTRILEQHFESAKRWVEFIKGANPNLLWRNSRGNDYNDWLNGDTLILSGYPLGTNEVPKEVFATAFFAHSTEIVAKMAAVLGRSEDAARYAALFESIKAAFNQAYVSADGSVTGHTQAGYALALNFNLLDANLRPKATAQLMDAIARYNGHLSTGIHATHRMMIELSDNGQHNEACRLINLRTVPSWGYMVDMGATTIWERWDGYVAGRGFQNPSMNSFNHWAFGSVGEWVWRTQVGINPDDAHPGFKHVVIHPRPGGGLTWAKGRYDSIRGPFISEWALSGNTFSLHVAVPPNATATVYVPAVSAATVTEGGAPAAQAAGVSFLRMEEGCAVYAVGSGSYVFAGDAPSGMASSCADVSLPNPGFEIPSGLAKSINRSYYEYNPPGAGWSFVGDPAVTNSGIAEGNGVWYYTQMAEGNHAAFLCQNGQLSVPVTFPTSGVYRLSFRAAARVADWGNGTFLWYSGHDFDITLNGVKVARLTTRKAAFEIHSFVLPAIKDGDPLVQTLAFVGVNSGGGDRASLLDDVRIYRMPTVANPGFETSASLANGTWEAGLADAGWVFCAGVNQRNQSGIARSGSDWGNTAPEGACNAFLQMKATIRQTLTFAEAGTYTLAFLAAARPNYAGHDFRVTFDGVVMGSVRTTAAAFQRYSFRLPCAKAGVPHVLAFEGINGGDDVDRASFIDSVILAKSGDPASVDAAAFVKTSIDLAPNASLELDYDDQLAMDRVTYGGRAYSGILSADNTPFIHGEGRIYVASHGAVFSVQ